MITMDITAAELEPGDIIVGAWASLSPTVVSVQRPGLTVDVVVEWNDGTRHPRPWQFDANDIVRIIPAS